MRCRTRGSSPANDTALYDRWSALEDCPEGSLGQGVWRFYRARGFTFPGKPNSAPPTLAQHDWIHVLADYGSTVESEIEVFGLIARANDDPAAFSLLAMVLGLFETGYLYGAAKGFFAYNRGHLSRDADRMGLRLGDAMYRGAKLAWHLDDTGRSNETDLLATDWFQHADRQLDELRADFGLLEKSARARDAGSVSPFEPGGISPFQYENGQRVAEAEGRPYDSYGAVPDVCTARAIHARDFRAQSELHVPMDRAAVRRHRARRSSTDAHARRVLRPRSSTESTWRGHAGALRSGRVGARNSRSSASTERSFASR